MPEDHELLRDYAFHHSENAFTELVRRHVDLVYSAALRETRGDGAMAEDITQAVFAELAGKASRLCRHPALAGWLYTCVRQMSSNARRSNDRRQRREQEAHTMNELLSPDSTESSWRQVQPVLDDAMHELSETDRAAVVLRFFEDRSHKEVGLALGLNESAARKRVDRALERLRGLLAKRGVTSGASGLVVVLSANAVQAAPVGLTAAITSAAATAGTTIAATATATAAKAIVMTTLQKTVITATLAAAVGTGIYEARQTSNLRTQVEELRQEQAPLAGQIEQLTRERDDAAGKLAALRDDDDRLNSNTTELLRLRGEVGRLRKQAEKESPPKGDTTSATTSIRAPTNQTEFEETKRQMSTALMRIGVALRQYMTNNPLGVIVDDSGQLNQDVFSSSAALPLDRFQVLVRDVQHLALAAERSPKLVIAKSTAPIPFDGYYTHFYLLADGSVTATTLGVADEPTRDGLLISENELRILAEAEDPIRKALLPALEAFAAANNGQRPTDPSQLQPYITTPEQQTMLQTEIEKVNLRNPVGKSGTNYQFGPFYYEPSPIKETER